MSRPDTSFLEIKFQSTDKRLVNKVKKLIQDHLLSDDKYRLTHNWGYSPKKGQPGKHWVSLGIRKTYGAIANGTDGGDYGND